MNIDPKAKEPINDWIVAKTGGIVQTGPFAGMKLLSGKSWDDGNLGCQLLGCYESELHWAIESEIRRLSMIKSPKIVNIGCAEGFYAVGLARRLPHATIYAVDNKDEAYDLTMRTAEANGVKNVVGKESLSRVVMIEPDLVVSDCEGFEVEYLDPEKYPALINAVMIVECHDNVTLPCTRVLHERFSSTHGIKTINEGARDPNQFEILQALHSLDRWAAVSEGRPCMMHYLVMNPHQPRVPQ